VIHALKRLEVHGIKLLEYPNTVCPVEIPFGLTGNVEIISEVLLLSDSSRSYLSVSFQPRASITSKIVL